MKNILIKFVINGHFFYPMKFLISEFILIEKNWRVIEMKKDEFIMAVMKHAGIYDQKVAERGIQIVLSILSHRLTKNEANDVASQLPDDLKKFWNNDVWITNLYKISGKRLRYRHKIELMSIVENEIRRSRLDINTEKLCQAVFHVLKQQVTDGECKDISGQLPKEIREFFELA